MAQCLVTLTDRKTRRAGLSASVEVLFNTRYQLNCFILLLYMNDTQA